MGTQALSPVAEEHLEAAWRALRQPAWPSTLAETMQDAARANLLMGYARTLAKRPPRMAPCPPPPRGPIALPYVPPKHIGALPNAVLGLRLVDLKRAAAGDRDDD